MTVPKEALTPEPEARSTAELQVRLTPAQLDALALRRAASKLYRELRWVGVDHLTAKAEVTRQVEDVCRG